MFDDITKRELVKLVKKYDTDIGMICKCLFYWGNTRCKIIGKNQDEVYDDYLKFWRKKIAKLGLDNDIVNIVGKEHTIAELSKPHDVLPFTKSEVDRLVDVGIFEIVKDKYVFTADFKESLIKDSRVALLEFKAVYPMLITDKNGVVQNLTPAPLSYHEIYSNAVHTVERQDEVLESIIWLKENYQTLLENDIIYYWCKQESFIDRLDDNMRTIAALKIQLANKTKHIPDKKENRQLIDELTDNN